MRGITHSQSKEYHPPSSYLQHDYDGTMALCHQGNTISRGKWGKAKAPTGLLVKISSSTYLLGFYCLEQMGCNLGKKLNHDYWFSCL